MAESYHWDIDWRGDDVEERLMAASQVALAAIGAMAVQAAKGRVRVRTATLQGSLRMEGPERKGTQVAILWGSFDVNYAVYQELGTSVMSAQPYLRPSADEVYPRLAAAIKAGL